MGINATAINHVIVAVEDLDAAVETFTETWGLTLDRHHIVVDPATCETNRAGVFAIGDIASYPGKLKLILTGFSEAAMAAHAIYKLVHPELELHWEYSTTKGVPGGG